MTNDHRLPLLDLYAGVGGTTRGFQLAGFHVTGVDIDHQPNYCGDEFVQADAVEYALAHGHKYAAISAAPPCQADCTLTAGTNAGKFTYPNLTAQTRAALEQTGRPYVIENPPGRTDLRRDIVLCGEMFGLGVIRHRVFELGDWTMPQPDHVRHRGRVAGMRHGQWFTGPYFAVYGEGGGKGTVPQWQKAMGIDWTNVRREIAEAIPPAYSAHIGAALARELSGRPAL